MRATKLRDTLRVRPGTRVRLADYDPAETLGYAKGKDTDTAIAAQIQRLDELQYLLYAENRHALLVVLQGMDAAGKDGTIRHVMTGLNPQGCRVESFKEPSAEEADHDFLWRIHRAVPAKGNIAIFNRSHYEDVLVVRVHQLVPKQVWAARYDQINEFERFLAENGIVVVKFFLHISKGEQKRRFQERLETPEKHWKISPADFAERRHWGAYISAYEAALSRCNTPAGPWYVIPSDKKWFRNLAVSQILVETLAELDMKFPKPTVDVSAIRLD